MRTLIAVSKKALANCSPSRRVDSIILNRLTFEMKSLTFWYGELVGLPWTGCVPFDTGPSTGPSLPHMIALSR